MADLIHKSAAIDICEVVREAGDGDLRTVIYRISKLPAVDAVSRGLFEQIKWERDIAMQQLEEHGIAFGAKKEAT